MKIKIITSNDPEELEKAVNEFIALKNVISINFNIAVFPHSAEFYAMILYDN